MIFAPQKASKLFWLVIALAAGALIAVKFLPDLEGEMIGFFCFAGIIVVLIADYLAKHKDSILLRVIFGAFICCLLSPILLFIPGISDFAYNHPGVLTSLFILTLGLFGVMTLYPVFLRNKIT